MKPTIIDSVAVPGATTGTIARKVTGFIRTVQFYFVDKIAIRIK
jgi:hypothetical protein